MVAEWRSKKKIRGGTRVEVKFNLGEITLRVVE